MSVHTKNPCVCVQGDFSESARTATQETKSQEGDLCELPHTPGIDKDTPNNVVVVVLVCWYSCSVVDSSVCKVLVQSLGDIHG